MDFSPCPGEQTGQQTIGTQCGYSLSYEKRQEIILHSQSENVRKLEKAPQRTWNWKRS